MTKPLIKPSDAKSWASCTRRVWRDNQPATGEQIDIDEFDQLIIELGLEHEKQVLDQLGKSHTVHVARSPDHTAALMQEGVDVIYQAQLVDREENLIGLPDFLIRHANGQYQAADAKLSLDEAKKEIRVQLGFYRRMLGNELPALVFHGDGSTSEIGDEANRLVDQFISEMRELLGSEDQPQVHYSHSKCKACPYCADCKPGFENAEALSLLYGVQGRAVDGLMKEGIASISQLAQLSADAVPDVPYLKGESNKHKAIMQARAWLTGELFKLKDFSLPGGTWIHFDIEDNPLSESVEKHVYLWGFLTPDYQDSNFEYVWTNHEDEDEKGWLEFLRLIDMYRSKYDDVRFIHYTRHEKTTIEKYAQRYAMQDHDIVQWLLGSDSPLFDIQLPVTRNLVLPIPGYGLKDICKHPDLVNFQWQDEESGSQWSVVQFHRFLHEPDPTRKAEQKREILGYNRDDVIATRRLEEWLRDNFAS